MYAVYHGPEGLRAIAEKINDHARLLGAVLGDRGVEIVHDRFFDTVLARVPGRAADIVAAARDLDVQVRQVDADHVGLSVGETYGPATFGAVLTAFGVHQAGVFSVAAVDTIPGTLRRERSSRHIAPRRRCCATCGGSRRATTPSTAA
jgi:glycine dehydrogenase